MPTMLDDGLLQYGSSDPVFGAKPSLGQWAGADASWLEKLRIEWAAAAILASAVSARAPSEALDVWGGADPLTAEIEREETALRPSEAEGWVPALSANGSSTDWLFG